MIQSSTDNFSINNIDIDSLNNSIESLDTLTSQFVHKEVDRLKLHHANYLNTLHIEERKHKKLMSISKSSANNTEQYRDLPNAINTSKDRQINLIAKILQIECTIKELLHQKDIRNMNQFLGTDIQSTLSNITNATTSSTEPSADRIELNSVIETANNLVSGQTDILKELDSIAADDTINSGNNITYHGVYEKIMHSRRPDLVSGENPTYGVRFYTNIELIKWLLIHDFVPSKVACILGIPYRTYLALWSKSSNQIMAEANIRAVAATNFRRQDVSENALIKFDSKKAEIMSKLKLGWTLRRTWMATNQDVNSSMCFHTFQRAWLTRRLEWEREGKFCLPNTRLRYVKNDPTI